MNPLKLNDCVATIDEVRYIGSAFVLPTKPVNRIKDEQLTDVWAVFHYTGTRTAEEDWHDFGPVDHIRSAKSPDMRQGGDARGMLLLKAGDWDWYDHKGISVDQL